MEKSKKMNDKQSKKLSPVMRELTMDFASAFKENIKLAPIFQEIGDKHG